MTFVAVRLRSDIRASREAQETLHFLGLHRINHAVVLPENPSVTGMLKRVSNHVTWGEVEASTLAVLLKKRGRIVGGGKLTDETVRQCLNIEGVEGLATAVCEGKVGLKNVRGLKPLFRLTPPSGGFEGSIKHGYRAKGELGYRGKEINSLLLRMS